MTLGVFAHSTHAVLLVIGGLWILRRRTRVLSAAYVGLMCVTKIFLIQSERAFSDTAITFDARYVESHAIAGDTDVQSVEVSDAVSSWAASLAPPTNIALGAYRRRIGSFLLPSFFIHDQPAPPGPLWSVIRLK